MIFFWLPLHGFLSLSLSLSSPASCFFFPSENTPLLLLSVPRREPISPSKVGDDDGFLDWGTIFQLVRIRKNAGWKTRFDCVVGARKGEPPPVLRCLGLEGKGRGRKGNGNKKRWSVLDGDIFKRGGKGEWEDGLRACVYAEETK